jgi:hypothetical protein
MESESEALCFDSKEEVSILNSACLGGEAMGGNKALPAKLSQVLLSPCCSRSSCRDFCACSDQDK